MGQRASCCCLSVNGNDASSSELETITKPLRLPAPPGTLLAPPTRRWIRAFHSSSELAALARSSPLSSRLPPAVVTAVYNRALYLYQLPVDHLVWKVYQTSPTAAIADPIHTVFYCSLHTAETIWQRPAHYTALTAADYRILPLIEWFPSLNELATSLHFTVRFHDDREPLVDSYYQRLITAASPSLPNLLYVLPLLSSVLSTYPASFYRRLPLHCVVLCERLRYKGVEWRCLPVLAAGRLYLSCERVDAVYLQSTLHHELFHFIDHSMQPTSPTDLAAPTPLRNHLARPDSEWCALNVPSFVYGDGGMSVREASASMAVSSPSVGLLNAYAASAVEEDKAEVWAALMRDERAVSCESDEIVRQKAALLRCRVDSWSEGKLGVEWWSTVAKRSFSRPARQSTK